MLNALTFCRLNAADGPSAAATFAEFGHVPLGGESTPEVSELAVAEFAAALGMAPLTARAYLADTLELGFRLPATWDRVQSGDVPVFRARMVAQKTHSLPPDAAAHVDREVAPIAHTVGPTQLLRIVDAARALYDPAEARARAERAAERREVRIYRDHPVNGVVEVVAGLDYADVEGSPALATIERVREWCTTAGTNVRVTPVVDLNDDLHRDGYQPSPSSGSRPRSSTAPASIRSALDGPARATWTTSSRTWRAARPPQPTSRRCAAVITDSRPSEAGATSGSAGAGTAGPARADGATCVTGRAPPR